MIRPRPRGAPERPAMSLADEIASALRSQLSPLLHAHVEDLARLLAEASDHPLSSGDVRARLAADPGLASLLQTLAGTVLPVGATAVSFGTGHRIGTVTLGDVAGRDLIKIDPTVIVNVTFSGMLRAAPPHHRAGILRMFEDYQAVFGGRADALADLDAFLADPESSCALVLEPTGRGKTALLIHWLARVQAAGGWTVVFAPISRRYQTAT